MGKKNHSQITKTTTSNRDYQLHLCRTNIKTLKNATLTLKNQHFQIPIRSGFQWTNSPRGGGGYLGFQVTGMIEGFFLVFNF